MKTLTFIGGKKTDFKERLIFEKEKDSPIINSKIFTNEVLKKYKYKLRNNDLYRAIVNYQVKKYGNVIYKYNTQRREYTKNFYEKTRHGRKTAIERSINNIQSKEHLENLERKNKANENKRI